MTYTFIAERCSDLPVAACCRVMKVSTSGFYAWRAQPCSDRDLRRRDLDQHHRRHPPHVVAAPMASPRVHAELRLGEDIRCSPQARRAADAPGRRGGHLPATRSRLHPPRRQRAHPTIWSTAPSTRSRRRPAVGDGRHRTPDRRRQGVSRASCSTPFSRRVVGWSIADHIRSELVVDAVQMAIWRRQPPEGQTIAHSDHGSHYTSWAFGRRLRGAGLLGSMGTIGDCFDNSVAESFFGTLQLELLDEHRWAHPPATRPGDLRLDRSLVQPAPPPLLLRHAQPHRLRNRQRGMIPTTNPSVGTGEAQTRQHSWAQLRRTHVAPIS